MRQCGRSFDYLLEADLDELRGISETHVGAHVRSCTRCKAAADYLLASTELLGGALGSAVGAPDVDAVLADAAVAATDSWAGATPRSRRAWRQMAAVALAASIVALMLFGDRAGDPVPSALAPRSPELLPTVEPQDNQNVAVLETSSPDITVLWFF